MQVNSGKVTGAMGPQVGMDGSGPLAHQLVWVVHLGEGLDAADEQQTSIVGKDKA